MASGKVKESWPMDTIYCEASCTSQDVYYVGSDDEDYNDEAERRRRYEKAGQKFLEGQVPFLLSASLQGPFDRERGWTNPWVATRRSKSARTTSAKKGTQSVEPTSKISPTDLRGKRNPIPHSLECHLPSPQSLKQVSISEGHPFLEDDELEMVQTWRHSVEYVQNSRSNFESRSQRASAEKSKKRKSTGDGWLKTDSAKRAKAQNMPQMTSKSSPVLVAQTSATNQKRFASKPDLKPQQRQPSTASDIKPTHRESTSQLISPPKNTPSSKEKHLSCPVDGQLDGDDSAGEEDDVAALSSPVSMHKQTISAPGAQKHSSQEREFSNSGSPELTGATSSESQPTQATSNQLRREENHANKVAQQDVVRHDESFAYKITCQNLNSETYSQKHIWSDSGASDATSGDAGSSASAPAREDTLGVCGDDEMKIDDLNQQTVPNSLATAEEATMLDHGANLGTSVEDTEQTHATSISTGFNMVDSGSATAVTEKPKAEMEKPFNNTGNCDSKVEMLPCEDRADSESNCGNQAAIAEDATISTSLDDGTSEENKPVVLSESIAEVPNEATDPVKGSTLSTEDLNLRPYRPSTAVEVDVRYTAPESPQTNNTEIIMANVEEPPKPSEGSAGEATNEETTADTATSESCTNHENVIPSIEDVAKEEPSDVSLQAPLEDRIPLNPEVEPLDPAHSQASSVEQDGLDNYANNTEGDCLSVGDSSPDPSSQLFAESNNRNMPGEESARQDSASDVISEDAQGDGELAMNCSPSAEGAGMVPTTEHTEPQEAVATPTVPEQSLLVSVAENALSISQQSRWHKETREQDDIQAPEPDNLHAKDAFTPVDATSTAIPPCDQSPRATEPMTPLHAKEAPVPADNTPCPMFKESTQPDKPEQTPETLEPSSTTRPGTPEPRFAFKSFASFMTPSPERFRKTKQRVGLRKTLRHPHIKGILTSRNYTAGATQQPKRVTWAPLPNETETPSFPDDPTSHGAQHDRPASPPPAAPLAELPTSSNDKFSGHFSAVVKRTDGLRHTFRIPKDDEPAVSSWQESNQANVQANGTVDVEMKDAPTADDCEDRGRIDREPSQSQEPMDMVEDMLCEMGDFWQPWNVDAELDQAKKASGVNVPELGIGSRNPW